MRKLEEFVNEKLKVSKDNAPLSLYEQGWRCTSIKSMYSGTYQAEDFLKTDIDLMKLSSIDTADIDEKSKSDITILDKIFLAQKRSKWCKKIRNVILSEFDFNDAVQKIQEILNNNAKCTSGNYNKLTYYVIRILDSDKAPAMVLSFSKL